MPFLRIFAAAVVAMSSMCVLAQSADSAAPRAMTTDEKEAMADRVKAEALRSWQAYKKYAWGHDELHPLSKQPFDWYGKTLLMTPVDALDTLTIMGLKPQADEARELIDTKLNLDQDIYVKDFEITIRLLGALISNYELTGDKRLLELADDLGRRMLPMFNSPTGMPYEYVNLHTGAVRGTKSNPAEIGSLLIEYGMLARHTGKQEYYTKAKRALLEVYDRRSPIGLVGSEIDVETGTWTDPTAGIMGGIDSYYEYLLKASILFGDQDCAKMWRDSETAIDKYLADRRPDGLWYGYADMNTGKRTHTFYGSLDAFYPAVLVLGGDAQQAADSAGFELQDVDSCRHRAGATGLREDADHSRELRAAARDYRVDLLPLPRDARWQVSGHGADVLRFALQVVPHRRGIRCASRCPHQEAKRLDGKLLLRTETLKYPVSPLRARKPP